jgi:hypothetical protein
MLELNLFTETIEHYIFPLHCRDSCERERVNA